MASNSWQYGNWNNLTSGQQSQGAGTLVGATPSYYSADYGGIAQTADPTASAASAIAGNQANAGGLANLANYWNQFNTQQLINEQNAVNPLWSQSMEQAGQNAYSELSGIIPQDVINQISQQAAERGISTGLGGGSQNVNAALLSALGLKSLDMTNLGLSNLGSVEKMTPTAQLFDTSPYMTTAADFQAAQTAANKGAAAAIPYVVAQTNLKNAQAGTKAGTTAAGTTPKVGSSAANTGTNWWNQPSDWFTKGNNWAGVGGAAAPGASTTTSGDWWNTYGPGAYSQTGGGQANLSTSQEQQLRNEGWSQSEIDQMMAFSSPDQVASMFGDTYDTSSSGGYADVPATP